MTTTTELTQDERNAIHDQMAQLARQIVAVHIKSDFHASRNLIRQTYEHLAGYSSISDSNARLSSVFRQHESKLMAELITLSNENISWLAPREMYGLLSDAYKEATESVDRLLISMGWSK